MKFFKIFRLLFLAFCLIILNDKSGFCSLPEVQTVNMKDPQTGQTFQALFAHPRPGERSLPAVIYLHGKIVEAVGVEKAKLLGYDLGSFVTALSEAGYAAIAPIRPANTSFPALSRATLDYLRQRTDIYGNLIALIGFSKGGAYALESSYRIPSLKAVVAMSPAMSDPPFTDEEIGRIRVPLLIILGKKELKGDLGRKVQSAVDLLNAFGKRVEYLNDYDGDHQWFWKVRTEYWKDVLAFIDKHMKEG